MNPIVDVESDLSDYLILPTKGSPIINVDDHSLIRRNHSIARPLDKAFDLHVAITWRLAALTHLSRNKLEMMGPMQF